VVRPEGASERHRAGVAWSALKGGRLICLSAPSPLQRLIDKQLARAGVMPRDPQTVNSLDTQIAMVEAGHGIAVVPSYGLREPQAFSSGSLSGAERFSAALVRGRP